MIRQPIRNNSSTKPVKPRVFDAIIDGDEVYLESKQGKEREFLYPNGGDTNGLSQGFLCGADLEHRPL